MVKIQKFNFDCMDVKIRFVNNYRNTEDDLSNPHRETHLYISLYNKVCIFIGCSPTITISPIFIIYLLYLHCLHSITSLTEINSFIGILIFLKQLFFRNCLNLFLFGFRVTILELR